MRKIGFQDVWDCVSPWLIVMGLMVVYAIGGLIGGWCIIAATEFTPWTYPAHIQEDYYRVHPGPYIFPRKYPSFHDSH